MKTTAYVSCMLPLPNAAHHEFEVILEQYTPAIFGIMLRSVHHDMLLAERLTATAFQRIFLQLETFCPARNSRFTWVLRIAVKVLQQEGFVAHLLPASPGSPVSLLSPHASASN